VLSREEDDIRAIAAGSDDVLAITRINGTWISEDIEPVTIEFEWQRSSSRAVLSEDEYICPMKLAAHLIHTLFAASGHDEAGGVPFASSTRRQTGLSNMLDREILTWPSTRCSAQSDRAV
jgi:hypothetical protein